MRKWGIKGAVAVGAAVIMAGSIAPAASAAETTQVPCEVIFGEYLCQQLNATGDFVDETVGNVGPIVQEWRQRAVVLANYAWDTAMCYVSGACPIIVTQQP